MICKSCGSTIPDNSAFCNFCGKKVETEPVCSNCGAVLPLGSKFCNICGTPVAESAPAPTPAAPAPKPAPAPAPAAIPNKFEFEYAGVKYAFKKPNMKFTVFGEPLNSIYFAYNISGADKIKVHSTKTISDSLGDWIDNIQSDPKDKDTMISELKSKLGYLTTATFSQNFSDEAYFYSDGWTEGFRGVNHYRLEATIGKVMSLIYTNGYLLVNILADLECKGNRREEWMGGDFGCEYVDWKPRFDILVYEVTPKGKLEMYCRIENKAAVSAVAPENDAIYFMDQHYIIHKLDQNKNLSVMRKPQFRPDPYLKNGKQIVWWVPKTSEDPAKLWFIDSSSGERSSLEI